MKTHWDKIKVGDFFIPDFTLNKDTLLYQKIDKYKSSGFNAILINTGELSRVFINPELKEHFQKVEVSFDVKAI